MTDLVHILVLEDDDFDFRVLSRHLASLSSQYEVTRAISLKEGLDLLGQADFDVAIVDYVLGQHTGLDFLKEISGRAAQFPVIMLTGADVDAADVHSVDHGATDFLPKTSITRELLSRTIRFALENHQSLLRERALKEMAETNAELYSKLLSFVGHEIGAPLEAMVEFLAKATAAETVDEAAHYSRSSQQAAAHMVEFVRNLTEFVHLDRGSASLNIQAVSLPQLISQAVSLFASRAAHKGVEIKMALEELSETHYALDGLRLRQVLINILKNAVQYTEEGTISVTASDADGMLTLSISDTGSGISEEKIAELLHGEPVASMNGLGIGLMISRQFLDMMHATLAIENLPDSGAHISISVPLDVCTDEALRA